uniref:Uncharacterized protein n=1 Tax=uncultured bacterium A1Q1_fos_75 TaxID=1256589 RepID=L7VYM5_9BACT|nr:hypothetical protein [uncultured bacterium A1Q1_fos_75]
MGNAFPSAPTRPAPGAIGRDDSASAHQTGLRTVFARTVRRGPIAATAATRHRPVSAPMSASRWFVR